MAPFLAGMVGNWVGGGLVDVIYRQGRWRASRQLPAMVGFALAAIGLIASLLAQDAVVAVGCILGGDSGHEH